MEGEDAGCRILLAGPDPPPPRLGPCLTVWVPVLKPKPVSGCSRLALACAEHVEAVAFTSPRAPRLLAMDARAHGVEALLRESLASRDVWAVGPATAESVERYLSVRARVPRTYTGAGLAAELAAAGYGSVAGLRSPQGVRDLAENLAAVDVAYCEVHVYTVSVDRSAVKEAGRARVDYIIATSPTIARELASAAPSRGFVAIGPTTAAALRDAGVEPVCTASPHTLRGVAMCLERLASRGRK